MKNEPAPRADADLSPAQRRYFYFTAATTGAAIMIVEILGAKMLAPFVGTSHFVWTAQIAVTLVALAAGYYVGGRWADRRPRLGSLYAGILVAALYLCGAVFAVGPVAYACLRFKLALGSLLASAFLFFVPLALLATVGPFLIRILTQSLQGVGGSVGRLISVSTLGSFAGTLLIGYVLIPLLPNSMTMILTAIALMLLSAAYFLIWGTKAAPKWAAAAVLAAGLGCGLKVHSQGLLHGEWAEEIYRANSNFGQMQVLQVKDKPYRYYLNDYLTQDSYNPEARQSTAMFTYMLHGLTRAYTTNLADVLCIGLGVGIVPMEFAREGVKVDVVEINPAVVPLARQFFDLEPEKLNLTIGDGRQFVNECRKQYGAIVLDAFLGESTPSHLMSLEAFTAMRRVLRPNGVLVINCFGNFEPGQDFLVASLQTTLAKAFADVRIHCDSIRGNTFFVASPAPLAIRRPPTFDHVFAECRDKVRDAFAGVVKANPDNGIVLTDDFNPVDYYDAAYRESVRRILAVSMRDL